jgi:hypothetical protein
MPHQLQAGDNVISNYPNYRCDASRHIMFSAIVTSVDKEHGTCSVKFLDGDTADNVYADEVRYIWEGHFASNGIY